MVLNANRAEVAMDRDRWRLFEKQYSIFARDNCRYDLGSFADT